MSMMHYLAAKIDAEKNGITVIQADDVVIGVLNTIYYVAGIAAVIVIIIAGIQYVVSDGDSNRIAQAKNALLYAIIGLVIVMAAFTITGLISGSF